jgi:hypothetical protein
MDLKRAIRSGESGAGGGWTMFISRLFVVVVVVVCRSDAINLAARRRAAAGR